jgi:two-component system, chemotaxis family, protein-glutamate methylesterase/glutaminase
MAEKNKIRVLIVDDSALVRQVLTDSLESDPGISVMATARDPFVAADHIAREIPDVIMLDVEMPRMDGITFLRKVMSQHPIPVVICSTLTEKGAETTIKALEYGAVDIVLKPRLGIKEFLEESRISICDVVKAAAGVRLRKIPEHHRPVDKKLTADAMLPAPLEHAMVRTTEKVIVVGASTGGTEALRIFLEALPIDVSGIVVVQHMPAGFTRAFANRLDSLCQVRVKEAASGDSVLRGQVLIAPGDFHTLLKRSGARYFVEVKEGPLVCRHRPSVDVLFRSTARYAGKNAIGVIMTGMGDDGARGLLEMKKAGARTIAQDEKSCVVFGMPKEAIKLGGADKILALEKIAAEIYE